MALLRDIKYKNKKTLRNEMFDFNEWSGRQDSNLRPLGPKPSALPS